MDRAFPVRTDVPHLSTEQMIEVDRAMIDDYGIALIQMMENAGRGLAHLARLRFLDGSADQKRVVVLAGTGGNGGGAMVCARRLATWGAEVSVAVTAVDEAFTAVPAKQLTILRRMAIPIVRPDALPSDAAADLIIDGVIGYGLSRAPKGAAKTLVEWANAQSAPVLSLDVPSGLDADSGVAHEPTVRAMATLTLALPKQGLAAEGATNYVGELYLADIGVPPELYRDGALGIEVGPVFAESDIVRVR